MDTESYEQIALSEDQVGDAKKWLLDGSSVQVLLHNDKAISVSVAQIVELKNHRNSPKLQGRYFLCWQKARNFGDRRSGANPFPCARGRAYTASIPRLANMSRK